MKKIKKVIFMTIVMVIAGIVFLFWKVSKGIDGIKFGMLDSGSYDGKNISN